MVVILAATKLGITPSTLPIISSFPENALRQDAFYPQTGQFLVSPDTPAVLDLMNDTFAILNSDLGAVGQKRNYSYLSFATSSDAEQYYRENYDIGNLLAGVDFTDGNLAEMNYSIRMAPSRLPSSANMYGSGGEGIVMLVNYLISE